MRRAYRKSGAAYKPGRAGLPIGPNGVVGYGAGHHSETMKIICPRVRQVTLTACAALSALLTGCVGPVQSPAPAPPPPRPVSVPPRPPAATNWHDMPATPGVWQWRREGDASIARFGDAGAPALFSMACNPSAGTIGLTRTATTNAATTMTITTTSQSRRLAIDSSGDGIVTAPLPARDPLLDAMAYSRGRFAVDVPGLASLYLPSWPEVSRVIEDCRAR